MNYTCKSNIKLNLKSYRDQRSIMFKKVHLNWLNAIKRAKCNQLIQFMDGEIASSC
jgi:hypothetical protein